MKRSMNSKGFTLIELLITMVLIAVIIAITIPNITGIIDNNKTNKYIEDAKRLVVNAEYRVRSDGTHVRPNGTGKYIILNLAYLDNSEFDSAPYGGKYDRLRSFVIMYKNSDREYHYLVQLIEVLDHHGTEQYRGVKLTDYENLFKDGSGDGGIDAKQFVDTYSADNPVIANTNTYTDAANAGKKPSVADIKTISDVQLSTDANALMGVYCLEKSYKPEDVKTVPSGS